MKWLVHTILLLGLLLPASADAATCFWVGGTGTWNNSTDTANWKSSTGGGVACAATGGVPKNAGDIATFDGASGGGTVTVNVDINIAQITMGAFTGTLDFSAHNNNVTLTTAFSGTGAGTRTLNLGNGNWTLTGTGAVWDMTTVTGLTFSANSSVLIFNATSTSSRSFVGGGLTYATVTVGANTAQGLFQISSANTIATLTATAPNSITFASGLTTTITNAFNLAGSSGSIFYLLSSSNITAATVSIASGSPTVSWAAIRLLACTGGATFTASNSLDAGRNSGITITPPATGGGGRIIGGWLLRRDLYHDNDNNPAWLEKAA